MIRFVLTKGLAVVLVRRYPLITPLQKVGIARERSFQLLLELGVEASSQ